jgi:hypothetical protein
VQSNSAPADYESGDERAAVPTQSELHGRLGSFVMTISVEFIPAENEFAQ